MIVRERSFSYVWRLEDLARALEMSEADLRDYAEHGHLEAYEGEDGNGNPVILVDSEAAKHWQATPEGREATHGAGELSASAVPVFQARPRFAAHA